MCSLGASAKVARAENKRGRRPSVQIVRRLVRSAAATFEIRSNLFENVRHSSQAANRLQTLINTGPAGFSCVTAQNAVEGSFGGYFVTHCHVI